MGLNFENSISFKTCSWYPAICVPKIVYLSAALIEISLLEDRAYFSQNIINYAQISNVIILFFLQTQFFVNVFL